ncbi:hypothetical protein DID88_001427 [Monilinia fructigena]|uniref:Pre-mRNA-processing factor 19 n=1 Tax=Monilinia fructigena TaxID=38457 RepID=A0A395IXE0_9HELO|nr:hypothetical protein DID88_001427 [Monilinia fructigena]
MKYDWSRPQNIFLSGQGASFELQITYQHESTCCAQYLEKPHSILLLHRNQATFSRNDLLNHIISENHKDPVTGEDLEIADLIDLKSAKIVTPRPPTLTSIPSLLSTFQNEWDALALESFTIRQQLHQTRQELSTALYQHDAAVRVIARLTKERDEARDALSKVSIGAGSSGNGDAMQVDTQGLPENLANLVDTTQAELSKSRRKRPVPKGWATTEDINQFCDYFSF